MPVTFKKHETQTTLTLDNFTGGMNKSVPPSLIGADECETMENMFLDPRSGRPRTRYPIIKYSATAAPSTINGLYFWKSVWFLTTSSGYMYYLDGSLNPVSIGALNGTSRPVFSPYNNKLIVASGGVIQYTQISGTPTALADVASGPVATAVFERYSRLVTIGDSTYPDRVQEGTYGNETTWDAADYGDVGFLDGTSVVGIAEAFDGLYIVFKRGSSGLKTYYVSSLSNTDPKSNLATDGHAPMSHAGVVGVMSKVMVMEQNYVSALTGTDQQGKILYDQAPGMKLHASFTSTSSGFAVSYPKDFQVWFIPDPTQSEAYVYHYTRNAWSMFTFGSRRIHSSFYDPVEGYLYLGCDDGHVYYYDHSATVYADTGGGYTQRLVTKTFATGDRETVVKSPIIHWERLSTGSGTFYIYLNYNETSQNWGTISVLGRVFVYDTRAAGSDPTYVYNTQSGGSDEMYVWDGGGSGHQSQRCDYNIAADAFQFGVVLTSGALVLDRIVVNIGEARKE